MEEPATILVVDDEPSIRTIYARAFGSSLSSPAGPVPLRVLVAESGERAVELASEEAAAGRPMVAGFFDVKLAGGIDGIETVRRVRALDPRVLCVMVTGHGIPKPAGMDALFGTEALDEWDYLAKPFSLDEIRQKARQLVSSWRRKRREERYREALRLSNTSLEGLVAERTGQLQLTNAALHEAQERIRRSEAEMRALLDSVSHGIVSLSLDGQVATMNSAAHRLLDVAEDAVGRPLASVVTQPEVAASLSALVGGEQEPGAGDRRAELSVRERGGQELALEAIATTFPTSNGPRVAVFLMDISERRHLEVELRHSQKLEAVGRLAAGIAHEINTPIQFVGDSVHFLRDSFDDLHGLVRRHVALRRALPAELPEALAREVAELSEAESRADLEYLHEAVPKAFTRTLDGVSRVASIVAAMKDFGRRESREKAPADLNRAIESTLTVARNEYKYVAELVTDLGELPAVTCLVGEVQQVILNLVVNAAHAIADAPRGDGEKGRITVSSRTEGDAVVLTVADTGTGIPESARSKVFEPFFTTKEVGKGTGQGLAIARKVVVEKHGGSLTFETETGRGTTFTIRLPVQPAHAEAAEAMA
jgi:PAS domain S-box-containing protein